MRYHPYRYQNLMSSSYKYIKDVGAHVSTWKTDNAGTSNNDQITIPTYNGGSYNCVIYWGDGESDVITAWNDAALTHTFPSAGTYTVKIVGVFIGFRFNNGGDCAKLISFINNGKDFRLGTGGGHFYGCANLTTVGNLITTGMTNMSTMFRGCSSLNEDLNLDTSLVTTFNQMFFLATSFNGSILSFDTSNVTLMGQMFGGCWVFNQPVSHFDTSKVTTFFGMFFNAFAFNQDISGWDIGLVTTMVSMLGGATSLSDSNYSNALIAWNAGSHQNNVTLDSVAKYEAGAAAARTDFVNNHGWTINDGGPA